MIYSACKHSYRQHWSQKRPRFALGEGGHGDQPLCAVKAAEAPSHSGHRASHPLPPTVGDCPPHSHSQSVQSVHPGVWVESPLAQVCNWGGGGQRGGARWLTPSQSSLIGGLLSRRAQSPSSSEVNTGVSGLWQ